MVRAREEEGVQKKKAFIGFYNIANFTTLLGALFSLAGCLFAFKGEIWLALILLIVAGIIDLFDGAVANRLKRSEESKAFGVQLDSLADVVSFGVAPIIISFCNGANGIYALIVYAFYLVTVIIRLAYFNSVTAQGDTSFFRGLPVTYVALVMPIVFLIPVAMVHVAMFAVLALLFILNIRMPKPKGIWYALFPLLAVGMIIVWCLK